MEQFSPNTSCLLQVIPRDQLFADSFFVPVGILASSASDFSSLLETSASLVIGLHRETVAATWEQIPNTRLNAVGVTSFVSMQQISQANLYCGRRPVRLFLSFSEGPFFSQKNQNFFPSEFVALRLGMLPVYGFMKIEVGSYPPTWTKKQHLGGVMSCLFLSSHKIVPVSRLR